MRVNKTLLVGATVTAGSLGWILSSKEKRNQLHNVKEGLVTKFKKRRNVKEGLVTKFKKRRKEDLPVEKGGNPDPGNIEDNSMVSEGAMTSVQYYNEKKQD
ncbi:hypothetical protein ACIGEL_00490 [Rossellomorea aquimaris]|uniref:hypothetical protein n=1 Tax=Rossellomorea aquimaris TaxID=189382 RepID=UPI0037CC0217